MFPLLRDKLQSAPRGTSRDQASHFYAPTKSHFTLSPDEQGSFWIDYCDAVADGRNPNIYEVLSNREALQLGFDVRLSFERQQVTYNSEVVSRLVDSIDQYVQYVIGVVQTALPDYFELSEQGSEYIACYLRRDDRNVLVWQSNNVEYTGRIVFPYARVRKEHISKFGQHIRLELQRKGDVPDEYLSVPPVTGLDTFITPIKEMTELYGSSSSDDVAPLKIYEIYGMLNTDVKTAYDLSKVFFPNLHTVVAQGLVPLQQVMEKLEERGVEYWTPMFLSNGFYENPLKVHNAVLMVELEAPKINMADIREGGEVLSKSDRARQLLTYVSVERVENEWSWLDLGQALHSVDTGQEGLRLWKWITTQSDVKTEDDCDMHWYSFEANGEIDIETLEYFASVDNPEQYAAFCKPDVDAAIDRAINLPENIPVAEAFKACFPHQFVCSSQAVGEWYHYQGHRWAPIDGTSTLMWWMIKKFQPKLEQIQHEITGKIAQSRDAEFKSRQQNKLTMIGQLINKLSKVHFLKGVCEAARLYYHKPNFERLKDNNPHYTATPSGVIDVRGGQGFVRPGKPQDYTTRVTRYPYPHTYTWEHPAVVMTMEYLRQVFRSKTLFDYFLRFSASLLLSGNNNKIFPIFSGQGNNSKSMLVRLFEGAFGNYACKLPTSLITGKEGDANGATPTLIHAQGAKVAFLEEPNKREEIQSGTVKRITGHDTQYLRDLFQKGSKIVEMNVTIVPILISNTIPSIRDCQEAIWNRTRVIEFLSKWSKDAPKELAEQIRLGIFPEDRFFDRNIPIMSPAFLWIMVNKYGEYMEMGLCDPPEVLQATENFRVQNNVYIHFTRDCVVQAIDPQSQQRDEKSSVELRELFNTFKNWWTGQELPGKKPTMTEFKENLEITWKTKADGENRWYGLRLNVQKREIESILTF